MALDYPRYIADHFKIVDKQGSSVPFMLNGIQQKYSGECGSRDIILKARQQGFSSYILARFTVDFIIKPNTFNLVVADNADNAAGLLERVKYFIQSWEDAKGMQMPLKYNSKYELHNEVLNCKYMIGTAENTDIGRSKTITNLHLSEAAFYKNFNKILSSALQSVPDTGYAVIETTANGFNEFREFWVESELGRTTFRPLFYPASAFYSDEFLAAKKLELKGQYVQEYPNSAEEAFLTSGDTYFDKDALKAHLQRVKEPDVSCLPAH